MPKQSQPKMIEVPDGTRFPAHPDRRYRKIYRMRMGISAYAQDSIDGNEDVDNASWNDPDFTDIQDESDLEVYDEANREWVEADEEDEYKLYPWEWRCIAPRVVPVLTPVKEPVRA